jgi:hypothetical protein
VSRYKGLKIPTAEQALDTIWKNSKGAIPVIELKHRMSGKAMRHLFDLIGDHRVAIISFEYKAVTDAAKMAKKRGVSENVQTMYNALASGALVWGRILADYTDGNHCVVFHGVNSKGELRVVDPSAYSRVIGVYEAATYTMPIQNFMRDHGDIDHFIIVTKK